MKKILIFLIGIVSFIGINTVSADTTTKIISNYYDHFEEHIELYNTYKEDIDYMINYWEENLSLTYPYYMLRSIVADSSFSINNRLILYASKENTISYNGSSFNVSTSTDESTGDYIGIYYDIGSDVYNYNHRYTPTIFYPNYEDDGWGYNYTHALISNNFIFTGEEKFLIPAYTSETLNISIPEIELLEGSIFPTVIDLYNQTYNPTDTEYVTINLNEYPYIALSLKDYTKRDTFYTNVYVKGNYCLTSVYNYGMTEKKDVVTGSKNQRCSSYYDTSTLVRTYILSQDIENNAIYYLKAYDTTKENIIKIDTSVFDITYITEETKDNPYVNVSGKSYPTIAYDNLTDSATISEDEDYISGVSCQVGDFNCYNEYNSENLFDELFSSPLDFLKNIWSSVTSIFDIITEFILLLPDTMQSFLYISFMIAIILGLLKIIL